MFDGIVPRRRRLTERERKTLQRMERAAWQAEYDAWQADRKAERLTKKFQRYAATVDKRLGPGGMFDSGNKGFDLLGEWMVRLLDKDEPLPGGAAGQ